MPDQDFRKTSLMSQLELRHGKDIKSIVLDALGTTETLKAAAEQLGVSEFTLTNQWMPRLGIEVQTTRKIVVQK